MRALLLAGLLLLAGCLRAPEPLPDPVAPEGAATFDYVPPGTDVAVHARLVPEPASILAGAPHAEVESAVAVDPTDPDHVVAFHIERTEPYITGSGLLEPRRPGLIAESLAASRDGGRTWTAHRLPQAGTAPPGSKWGLFCTLADPNVFFDSSGLVHIVTLGVSCSAPGYLLATHGSVIHATTRNDGATWSEPDLIWASAGGSIAWIHDRQWSAYDPASGRMVAAWSTFVGFLARSSLVTSTSTDGGRTWSAPQELDSNVGPAAGHNYLVHVAFGSDGVARIATHAGADGRSLAVFRGMGDGEWRREEYPMCASAPSDGFYDYPTIAPGGPHPDLVAAAVFVAGRPAGVCVQLLGETVVDLWIAEGEHPWLAAAADGTVGLAYLQNADGRVTPTLALLGAAELSLLAVVPLGDPYDVDVEDDGVRETSHYDTMALSGSTLVWTLTRPNGEGRPFDRATVDMDIWAYRARIEWVG